MKNNTVDIETLIHTIEKMKKGYYEGFRLVEGLENPDVLAQTTSSVMGAQLAFDDIIAYLRRLHDIDSA